MREYEPGITGIGAGFAIGQRALLLRTSGGNVLWDCVATLDAATVTRDQGVSAASRRSPFRIRISTPRWWNGRDAFDCHIHLNAADRQWIMRPDPAIYLWEGDTFKLWDGVTLIRCGGHFEGGTVLHWQEKKNVGASGRGVVCSGDILTVATDRKWLSFMRSYPNFIPLSAREVAHIGQAMAPFSFDTLYGHYFDRVIPKGAKLVLEKSVERYIAAVEGKRGY